MASSPGHALTLIDGKDITLGKKLGGGGFGDVYKASHVNWGDVAVKRLKGVTLTADVEKEADRMLRVVSSPYLVTVMGLIKNPGDVGIVMEFFENGSLKEFEQKYMKCDCWARKVKMVQDIALGMNYLHTLKPPIIHRDLKLENVFVGNGFEAKIGDLGLAVSSMTSRRYAHVSGTRSHIPPEASNPAAAEPDEFWDIYTFAITSYELVSGKDAWPQQQQFANDALIAVWVLQGHRPNLDVIPPEASSQLIDIIKKCWVAEPKERPSFKDILNSVTELFETNYKLGLRKADRAILEQMDLQDANEARAQESGSSATDSGVGSDFWGSLEVSSVKDNSMTAVTTSESTSSLRSGTAATESGLGSDIQGSLEALSFKDKTSNATGPPASTSNDIAATDIEVGSKRQGEATSTKDTTMTATGPPDSTSSVIASTDCGTGGEGQGSLEAMSVEDNTEAASTAASASSDSLTTSVTSSGVADESNVKWQYKQTIKPVSRWINACRMISHDHLAVCAQGCVEVYEVNAESSRLAYTVTSSKWKAPEVRDVAISEVLPNSMLVICQGSSNVYRFPCHETRKEIQKYKIHMKGVSDKDGPWCMAANPSSVVIKMCKSVNTLVVYKLPYFAPQSNVQVDFIPHDLSFSRSGYLLVLGEKEMLVKALHVLGAYQDVCRIKPPDGWIFKTACFRKNAREIYAGCQTDGRTHRFCVYKYIWDGAGKPEYANSGCVTGLGPLWNSCLSVTSVGLLAVGQLAPGRRNVSIFEAPDISME